MAENTKIEWADHTFNPWWGCTKISPACDNCYAEALDKRTGGTHWETGTPRRRTGTSNWAKPMKWNRDAEKAGKPAFVFCASMADVFDNQVPKQWRVDLWALMEETPHLIWLVLTKRPQNIAKMKPGWRSDFPRNVWLGTTVENQEVAERNIPHLLKARCSKRFLSCEPLLGPIDLRKIAIDIDDGTAFWSVDWVIAGGESGHNARTSHPDWYRSLRDQCARACVDFFFKQWGEWIPGEFSVPPDLNFQNGEYLDANCLPDFDDPETAKSWDNGLGYAQEEEQAVFHRVGKKRAGRLLDGVEHNARPEAKVTA